MEKNKGITLIALVITIIVLLILAGVTIATLTGDNGLLQKATSAKEENEQAKELELIKLAVSAAQVAGEGKLTTGNLNTELQANFNDTKTTATEIQDGWSYRGYKIETNGNIFKLLPEEYQPIEYIESTGKQYINFKKTINKDTNIMIEFEHLNQNNTSWKSLFGYRNQPGGSNMFAVWIGNNKLSINYGNVDTYGVFELEINKKYILKNELNNWYLNNKLISSINSSIVEDDIGNIVMFAIGTDNDGIDYRQMCNKLYSLKIYKRDQLQNNFIPCKSVTTVTNADGNPVPADTKGLYDLVEGNFYTNANTSEDAVDFIAGPEV